MSEAPQIALPGIEAQRGDVSSNACFTPKWFIDCVERALGCIETDPYWHPDCHVADYGTRYDGRERGDGNQRQWHGSVWFQPPYGAMEEPSKRMSAHVKTHPIAPCLGLIRHDPSTEWWKRIVNRDTYVGTLDRRICFEGAYAKGGTPSMIVTPLAWNFDAYQDRLIDCFPMVTWRAAL